MYQLTRILPDDTVHPHTPVASIREAIFEAGALLVDADVEPRLARRFALHLSRQPLGKEIRHEGTRWRFRIDQVDAEGSPADLL